MRFSRIEWADSHYGNPRGASRHILNYPIQSYRSSQDEFGLKLGLTGLAYDRNGNHEADELIEIIGRSATLDSWGMNSV